MNFNLKYLVSVLICISLSGVISACEESWRDIDYVYPEVAPTPEPEPEPEPEPRPETNAEIVALGWSNVSNKFGDLPESINIYRSPETLQGEKAVAYIAVATLYDVDFDVWSIHDVATAGTTESLMTPSSIYSEKGSPTVVLNGGYFFSDGGKNYSSSLAVSNGELLATNINYASADWVKIYTPTRGALLLHADGSVEACWTYYTWDKKHYTYPQPAPNSWENEPLETPGELFPEGAESFEAVTAIGGGPVLVRGGEFKNTIVEEMFDGSVSGVNPEDRHPRTAIGVTGENKIITFVCEGREVTEGVFGLSTEAVARVMMELGCVEAINLDGGASSCMLVNGMPTIKVSAGEERAIASAVLLK